MTLHLLEIIAKNSTDNEIIIVLPEPQIDSLKKEIKSVWELHGAVTYGAFNSPEEAYYSGFESLGIFGKTFHLKALSEGDKPTGFHFNIDELTTEDLKHLVSIHN